MPTCFIIAAVSIYLIIYFINHKAKKNSFLQRLNFKWQIHSYNDLRQFQGLLQKGSKFFKFDFFYLPPDNCSDNFQNINTSDTRGCFVLSHDYPISTIQYNTSNEIINILNNINYQSFFKICEATLFAFLSIIQSFRLLKQQPVYNFYYYNRDASS